MSLYEPDEEYPSWETLASRTGKLEITMAAIGRQVERITEHLDLAADEEGTPVEVLPFPPPVLSRHMLGWLSEIRDIVADGRVSATQAGERIRAMLFPWHIHADDGTVEGCPGCFPPGDVIPRTAMPPASPRCGPGCGHEPEGREIALAEAEGRFPGRPWMAVRKIGHTHPGDGPVAGCHGCLVPEPEPEQARARVHVTVQAGSLLTISWAGELRTVICAGTGPGGMLLRDLTADEQDALDRQQEAGDEMRRREAP